MQTASWNVRSLLDDTSKETTEIKTALIDLELHRYNIDIAALRETRSSGKGSITEHNYTLLLKRMRSWKTYN